MVTERESGFDTKSEVVMKFEELMRRYKKIRDEVGVAKTRLVSLEKVVSQLPDRLKGMSEEEILTLCDQKLQELEVNSAEAKELFEKIENFRSTYGS